MPQKVATGGGGTEDKVTLSFNTPPSDISDPPQV